MLIRLDKKFRKNLQGKFGKYQFQVGVLQDKPHREPFEGSPGLDFEDRLQNYAGGLVRKTTRKPSGLTVSEVSANLRHHMGVNYLIEPFHQKSSDIIKFTNEFFKLVFGRSQKKRAENLLQAVVRNPILRGDYGNNSRYTTIIKGFDRFGIDTGQLFKAIKAVCNIKGGPK